MRTPVPLAALLLAASLLAQTDYWVEKTILGDRGGAVMVYDAVRQRCVLAGGDNWIVFLDDTWEYDGQGWTRRLATPRPAGGSGSSRTTVTWPTATPSTSASEFDGPGSSVPMRRPCSRRLFPAPMGGLYEVEG